ncbi:MAG: hypothetical protein EOP49_38290, partial [Sphingobacteriales bacterium]
MPKNEVIAAIEEWCRMNEQQFTAVHLFHLVCKHFGFTTDEMMNGDRFTARTEARTCFAWFGRKLKADTLDSLAGFVDRDHTSIISLDRRGDRLLAANDAALTPHIISIYDQLKQLQ